MFKLPILQPHLTGQQNNSGADSGSKAHGTSTPSKNVYGSFLSSTWPLKEASTGLDFYGGSAEVKDWEAQGRDITAEVTCSDKYKSLALHAEVKLAEALERCTRLCPDAYSSDGEGKPNKLKTAVCSQLLGEFAELCGPFGSALKTIRDELISSIYSPLYASDRGLLVFDQIPWFKVAERLESEKEMMLEERKRFQEMLDQQQEMVGRIEDQVDVYKRAIASTQQELLFLRSRVENLSKSEEGARLEAKTGREELKRARKEWLKMKDDLDAEKEAHKQTKAQSEHDISALQQHMRILNGLVQQAEKTAREAQHSLLGWVPPNEVEDLQTKINHLKQELSACKSKLGKVEEKLKEQVEAMGSMTPRPTWRALHAYGIQESEGKRTQALVLAAAQKLASQAEDLHTAWEHAKLVQAVNLPEPLPREIKLAVTTDASAYFITEAPSASPTTVQIEALGVGPKVPRCLRWAEGELLEVSVMRQQDAEAMAMQILEAKRVYDAHHVPEHLQSFLYTYLSTQCPRLGNTLANAKDQGQTRTSALARSSSLQRGLSISSASNTQLGTGSPTAAAVAAQRSSTRSSGSGASLMQQPKGARALNKSPSIMMKGALAKEVKESLPPAQADHAEVVKSAYALYYALRVHAGASPILRLFGRVLAGALPEEALAQQRLLFGAIAHAARRIAHAHATRAAHERAAAVTSAAGEEADGEGAAAEEHGRAAAEQAAGAADTAGSTGPTSKPKRRRGKRGSQARASSLGGELEKEEEEVDKEAEATAAQVAIDPSDLVVSTEHMLGALQALLPGRSSLELGVLQDAYSSCVASPEQQQQQQQQHKGAGVIKEEYSSGSVMPVGACPLGHLEELLQPMVLGCSAKAIAAQASIAAAGNTERQMQKEEEGKERRARFLAGRLLGHTLSNGFVCMLMTELIDGLEEAASELAAATAAAAASMPEAAGAGGEPKGSLSGSNHAPLPSRSSLPPMPPALEPTPSNADAAAAPPSASGIMTPPLPSTTSLFLGRKMPAGALVQALVGVGLPAADAVRVVGGTVGCGSGGGASFAEALVGAWQHGMLDGVPVWSNLAMATARATALLQRPGTHDVRGMLEWVDRLCADIMGTFANEEGVHGECTGPRE